MNIIYSLVAVLALVAIAYLGVDKAGLYSVFGMVLPYVAVVLFLGGLIYRVLGWAKSPVPFRIPTTCGQQKSHSWIKQSKYDNPSDTFGVIVRMALEILLFRSLFRNTKAQLNSNGPKLAYASSYWLWLFSLVFHWTFLIVLLRHLRFFAEPIPAWVLAIQNVDGFLQIGVPLVLVTGILLLASVTYLFLRRLYSDKLRYISLPSDYFPLFLIIGIATTGILMRYFYKTDVVGIKEITMGLVTLSPVTEVQGISSLFYVHFFLVTVLFAYFPFSKLVHGAGAMMSPTRNLANNNRAKRHINPWNDPNIKPHPYSAYEDEFREKMKAAGIPVEKE